jgi:hypothetical protein
VSGLEFDIGFVGFDFVKFSFQGWRIFDAGFFELGSRVLGVAEWWEFVRRKFEAKTGGGEKCRSYIGL